MGWSPRTRQGRERVTRALRSRVRIDARALAAFRVALGLLLLADLLLRSRNLRAFYTDAGVLPRSTLVTGGNPLHPSVHLAVGDAWGQALLFAVAGAFALALTIGYRTTLATAGSWLLLVSLHNRMPGVLNGGDVLLRLLLFWALFLPLGAYWSVDSRQGERGPDAVASVASAALLCQVVLMYATNAALKSAGEYWVAGTGIQYAFSLEQFTVLLGDHLAAFPTVLHVLDYLWLAAITFSFLLVVLRGWKRVALVAAFVGLHLGMVLTMRLGLFPLISVAGLLPFLPPVFWNELSSRVARRRPVAALARWHARLADWLPTVRVSGVPAILDRWHARVTTVVPLVFLVLVILWNVQFLGYTEVAGYDTVPEAAEPAIELTRTDQYWSMFAPDPYLTDGWVVAPGTLANGSRVDAFRGGAVSWGPPDDVSATYPTARWRKYLVGLWRYDTHRRELFAEYLCDRWDRTHESDLREVSVYFVEQPTRLGDTPEPTRRVELATVRC